MLKKHLLLPVKKFMGMLLILLGLFALFTPLTPGSWLALIGLEMLGFGFVWRDIVRPKLTRISKKERR